MRGLCTLSVSGIGLSLDEAVVSDLLNKKEVVSCVFEMLSLGAAGRAGGLLFWFRESTLRVRKQDSFRSSRSEQLSSGCRAAVVSCHVYSGISMKFFLLIACILPT